MAPMTVMRRDYVAEILDGLSGCAIEHHHVLLDVQEDELVRRIETEARQLRLDQLESYHEILPWIRSLSHIVDTTALDAAEGARTVAGRLAATEA